MKMAENFRKEILATSQEITTAVARDWPNFSLRFVLYRRGQRQDEYERILTRLAQHPCEKAAREILRETSSPDNSSFVGIATGVEKKLLGLQSKFHFLGFAAINLDLYSKPEECISDLYHITAQALDTYHLLTKKNSPLPKANAIFQPKRNYLALARNNLKSDVFSALALYEKGQEKAVDNLALRRAKAALTAQSSHHPENYPFVISTDVMNYTVGNILNGKSDDFEHLLKLSDKIAVSFDKHHLKSWINFCSPAQTMAWNGFAPEEILGAALYTSSDPFIKATANLICEITQIKPFMAHTIANATNPYVDNETNSRNHAKLMEETFETAIINAIETDSHLPLIRTANSQNDDLLKGRVLGWCADALQSAARTFEQSSKKGMAPGPASRIEFQRVTAKADWESLETLNVQMLGQRRSGRAVTFSEIINMCGNKLEFRSIMDSLRMTMSDPEYSAQLSYVNDLPKPQPHLAPSAAPQAAPQVGYAPTHAPAMMGGGMMGGGTPVTPQKKIAIAEEEQK